MSTASVTAGRGDAGVIVCWLPGGPIANQIAVVRLKLTHSIPSRNSPGPNPPSPTLVTTNVGGHPTAAAGLTGSTGAATAPSITTARIRPTSLPTRMCPPPQCSPHTHQEAPPGPGQRDSVLLENL